MSAADATELAIKAVEELLAYDERPMRLEAIAVRVGKASALLELACKQRGIDHERG